MHTSCLAFSVVLTSHLYIEQSITAWLPQNALHVRRMFRGSKANDLNIASRSRITRTILCLQSALLKWDGPGQVRSKWKLHIVSCHNDDRRWWTMNRNTISRHCRIKVTSQWRSECSLYTLRRFTNVARQNEAREKSACRNYRRLGGPVIEA